MAKSRGITLKGAAARAFVGMAQAEAEATGRLAADPRVAPVDDAQLALRVASLVHLHMTRGGESGCADAEALIRRVATDGLASVATAAELALRGAREAPKKPVQVILRGAPSVDPVPGGFTTVTVPGAPERLRVVEGRVRGSGRLASVAFFAHSPTLSEVVVDVDLDNPEVRDHPPPGLTKDYWQKLVGMMNLARGMWKDVEREVTP